MQSGRPTSLSLSYSEFSNTLALFISEDPNTSADDVGFRFDILWSRQSVTATDIRDHTEWLQHQETEAVGQFGKLLRDVEDKVVTLQSGDTETAKFLHTVFSEFLEPLHSYTIMVKDEQAKSDSAAREKIWHLSQLAAVFGGSIAIVSLLLAALFYLDAKRHHKISALNLQLLKQAQAAYRAKVEFLSTVSHELRTPLTSIKGVLSFFCAGALGPLNDKAMELSRIALHNSDKLESLISDIMDSAKSDRSDWSFEFENFDLVSHAQAVADSLLKYMKNRTVRVVNKAGGAIRVYADPKRTDQVISNLLSNALKFSEEDTDVILTVDSTDMKAQISVQDFGSGIPMEFRNRIYEEFTQANSSDTRSAGGTGLGLSITKRIVERHGGTISFESNEGLGTTFTVVFPLKQAQAETLPSVEAA